MKPMFLRVQLPFRMRDWYWVETWVLANSKDRDRLVRLSWWITPVITPLITWQAMVKWSLFSQHPRVRTWLFLHCSVWILPIPMLPNFFTSLYPMRMQRVLRKWHWMIGHSKIWFRRMLLIMCRMEPMLSPVAIRWHGLYSKIWFKLMQMILHFWFGMSKPDPVRFNRWEAEMSTSMMRKRWVFLLRKAMERCGFGFVLVIPPNPPTQNLTRFTNLP